MASAPAGEPASAALERSRTQLRSALFGTPAMLGIERTADGATTRAPAQASTGSASAAGVRIARTLATSDLTLHATWWQLAHELADALLAPTARRHPWALLAGSASAGALLAQLLMMQSSPSQTARSHGAQRHVLRRLFSVAVAVTPPGTWLALARWVVRAAAHTQPGVRSPAAPPAKPTAPLAQPARRG